MLQYTFEAAKASRFLDYTILSSDDQDAAKVAYSGDDPPAPPDEDGDGIVDPQDDCDSTEAGKLVFRDGCNHGWASGDDDSDGDGFADDFDAFPTNSSEWADSDSDGVGDNSDVFPTNSSEWADSDSDGVGDNSDVFPTNSSEWTDSDSDSVGDNSDLCPNTNTGIEVDSDGCSNDQKLDDDEDNVPLHKRRKVTVEDNKSTNVPIDTTTMVKNISSSGEGVIDLSKGRKNSIRNKEYNRSS